MMDNNTIDCERIRKELASINAKVDSANRFMDGVKMILANAEEHIEDLYLLLGDEEQEPAPDSQP